MEVYAALRKHFMASYDDTGSIGKRYRRGDAIGTPFAATIDDNTLVNGIVTLRERDSMKQIDLHIDKLAQHIGKEIAYVPQ